MSAAKCGELFWNDVEGYGYVVFTPEFKRDEPIVCLDAISDWTTGLGNEYADHIKRSQQKFDQLRSKARRVTKKR
jgi:hypothetical protein